MAWSFPSSTYAFGSTFELSNVTEADVWRAARWAAAGAAVLAVTRTLYRTFIMDCSHDSEGDGALFYAFATRQKFSDIANLKKDPYYFDLSKETFAAEIESNWEIIRDELREYLDKQGGSLRPFGHTHRMSSTHCWRILSLMLWRIRDPRAEEHFPRTLALVRRAVPADRLVGITFSQLEPESDIAPHVGDTNGNYRCHLGLIVPRGLPDAGLEVGGEQRSWVEGKMFAFNDAHLHRAWNGAPAHRFILLLDVMREEHKAHTNKVCCYVMASFVLQRLANKWTWINSSKRMQANVHSLLNRFLSIPIVLGVGQGFVHRMLSA